MDVSGSNYGWEAMNSHFELNQPEEEVREWDGEMAEKEEISCQSI